MDEYEFFEIETMEEMMKRLAGCGSGAQVRAVIKSIQAINAAGGQLDQLNTATALYHLACVLAGKGNAMSALSDAATLAECAI